MKDYSVYRIAGIDFAIKCADPYFKEYCRGYESDGEPGEYIEVTSEDIAHECSLNSVKNENLCARASIIRIYREIAQRVIDAGGFIMHSAAIEYKGKAIAFLAPSGTGKTTHIKLWRRLLKDKIGIINGDKPIIMPDRNGRYLAYGTPWAGKEGWQRNVSFPISAICSIHRSDVPEIRQLPKFNAFEAVTAATIVPTQKDRVEMFLCTIENFVSLIPSYKLGCNMNEESAILSFETITGEKYTKN